MNVHTDLKAGGLVDDATQEVDAVVQEALNFVNDAGQSAEGFTSTVSSKATSLWNCLTTTLGV